MQQYTVIYHFSNPKSERNILGPGNKFLKIIEEHFQEEILINYSDVKIKEDSKNIELIRILFLILEAIINNKNELQEIDVVSILNNLTIDNYKMIIDLYSKKEVLLTTASGRVIYPRTLSQKLYIDSLDKNDIVFAVGPAGTGKTFLAVMYAVSKLKNNEFRKIVLVRPVVEAGEKLGYLPGDVKEKIDPYLVPLYDGLYEALGREQVEKLLEKGILEVAPLAYMRGRTLENSLVILDEAQNASILQMKMFLTRLGYQSKMIITGDITQVDLPYNTVSGLIHAINILDNVDNLKIIHFKKCDVMRHPLVQKIIERYDGNGD
jgi:phosphate starvation-inducible PhoH-like protein